MFFWRSTSTQHTHTQTAIFGVWCLFCFFACVVLKARIIYKKNLVVTFTCSACFVFGFCFWVLFLVDSVSLSLLLIGKIVRKCFVFLVFFFFFIFIRTAEKTNTAHDTHVAHTITHSLTYTLRYSVSKTLKNKTKISNTTIKSTFCCVVSLILFDFNFGFFFLFCTSLSFYLRIVFTVSVHAPLCDGPFKTGQCSYQLCTKTNEELAKILFCVHTFTLAFIESKYSCWVLLFVCLLLFLLLCW